MEDVVPRMAHVGARDNDREEVWAGGGLVDQTRHPWWAEGVVQSVWFQCPGQTRQAPLHRAPRKDSRAADRSALPGREGLNIHSVGDGSAEELQGYGWTTPKL